MHRRLGTQSLVTRALYHAARFPMLQYVIGGRHQLCLRVASVSSRVSVSVPLDSFAHHLPSSGHYYIDSAICTLPSSGPPLRYAVTSRDNSMPAPAHLFLTRQLPSWSFEATYLSNLTYPKAISFCYGFGKRHVFVQTHTPVIVMWLEKRPQKQKTFACNATFTILHLQHRRI
jgi:hypothetical protein